MNSAETLQQGSPPPRLTWRTVLAAWCGITRVEVIAAFLFGSAYLLYSISCTSGCRCSTRFQP